MLSPISITKAETEFWWFDSYLARSHFQLYVVQRFAPCASKYMATNSSQFTSPASLKRSTAVETLASAAKALGKSKVSAFWKPWYGVICFHLRRVVRSCSETGIEQWSNTQPQVTATQNERELARIISDSSRLCLRTSIRVQSCRCGDLCNFGTTVNPMVKDLIRPIIWWPSDKGCSPPMLRQSHDNLKSGPQYSWIN